MNLFKRIYLSVFSVAGLLCLLALALPWFGPWVELTQAFLRMSWYRAVVLACVVIAAIGLLVTLGRAIFTPKERKTVVVSRSGSNQVTVATAAISSQAAHIVEAGRLFFADKVSVAVNRRGKAKVAVRVHPAYAVNVAEEGPRLHEALENGLAALCGDAISSISLEFVEPDSQEEPPAFITEGPSAYEIPADPYASVVEAEFEPIEDSTDEPLTEQMPKPVPAPTSEVTVSMGHTGYDEVPPVLGEEV